MQLTDPATDNLGRAGLSRDVDSHFFKRFGSSMLLSIVGGYANSLNNGTANTVVPVAVSASHIAYGSIRMEPVFMILGQSSGAAASLALERHVDVQDVPYKALRHRLLAEGQVLTLKVK